jgi:hypothetical protein
MILLGCALGIILILLLRFTGAGNKLNIGPEISPDQIPAQVIDVSDQAQVGDPVRSARRGELLLDLMVRLGASQGVAEEELRRRGYEGSFSEHRSDMSAPSIQVVDAHSEHLPAIERALLVGIHIARSSDDHAGVSDGRPGGRSIDVMDLQRRAEEAEVELFGEGRYQRWSLCGKATLVLQDMLDGAVDPKESELLKDLLESFDQRLKQTRDEIDRAMALLPDSNQLLWGSDADRRLYYFKMGVTNALRRSGFVQSLDHLYRLQGVNYDVEEAYDLASQEADPLVLADAIGIERLVTLTPSDVHNLVHRSLPSRMS